jgi:predicted DCC family thiol-disulfide oxidoreductase YuxK
MVYVKSIAALRIARKLSWLWPMLYIFIILPPVFRNAVNNYISRNRYKWFGTRHSCLAPSAVNKEKILL